MEAQATEGVISGYVALAIAGVNEHRGLPLIEHFVDLRSRATPTAHRPGLSPRYYAPQRSFYVRSDTWNAQRSSVPSARLPRLRPTVRVKSPGPLATWLLAKA